MDVKRTNIDNLVRVYKFCKREVIRAGHQREVEFFDKIPPLDKMNKWYFFREYVWVVLNTGMKNQVAEKIFRLFWNNGNFNFDEINHQYKKRDIEKVYLNLDNFFKNFQESENKLEFLESIPFIGKKTKFHLAKNLGLNYAKPDRHLERIAAFFHYDSVQDFCEVIAKASYDDIKVVDVVFWRYANLFKNYLDHFKIFLVKTPIDILAQKCDCGADMVIKGGFRYGNHPHYECPNCGNIKRMIYYD